MILKSGPLARRHHCWRRGLGLDADMAVTWQVARRRRSWRRAWRQYLWRRGGVLTRPQPFCPSLLPLLCPPSRVCSLPTSPYLTNRHIGP